MNTALARSRRRRVVAAVVTALVISLVVVILTVQQSLSTASAAATAPHSAPVAGTATVADGKVADGVRVSMFDDVPAVTGLDDALRAALQ
ncbi:MAG: hypothetical protein WBA87_15545, partial [Microbacterium sp.]